MAIKSIGKIILYEPLDGSKIDDFLSSADTIVFEVERAYNLGQVPPVLSAVLPTQFDDVSIDYIDALKKVIDICSWQHIQDGLFFKINYNNTTKQFDLTNSYVRDSKDTSGSLTAITTGQILMARFSTPGLDETILTDIELPYNQAISNTYKDAIKELGVELNATATGDLFQVVDQKVPYKIEFYKPVAETLNYVVDFNYKNIKIEV